MKNSTIAVMLAALLVGSLAHAADEGEKKKPAAEKKKPAKKSDSDKNVFQKAESATGDFLNRNKLWTTHPDNKKKE